MRRLVCCEELTPSITHSPSRMRNSNSVVLRKRPSARSTSRGHRLCSKDYAGWTRASRRQTHFQRATLPTPRMLSRSTNPRIVISSTILTFPDFSLFMNTDSPKRKPLFAGAVAVALLGSVAAIGVPAGWYTRSKAAAVVAEAPPVSRPPRSRTECFA